jgi:hypothetical protein
VAKRQGHHGVISRAAVRHHPGHCPRRGHTAVLRARDRVARRLVTVWVWAFVPLCVLFLLSQLSAAFWIGYALPMLPGVLILIAAGAQRAPKLVALPLFVALTGFALRGAVLHPLWYHEAGWRSAARALAVDRRPGDPVVFDIPASLAPAGFYADQFTAPNGYLVVTEWGDEPVPPNVFLLMIRTATDTRLPVLRRGTSLGACPGRVGQRS